MLSLVMPEVLVLGNARSAASPVFLSQGCGSELAPLLHAEGNELVEIAGLFEHPLSLIVACGKGSERQ